MIEIKKIKPLSLANVMAILFLIYAFIAAIVSLIFDGFIPGFWLWSLLVIPLMAAVSGFLSGFVSAFLYNIVVKLTGGIKFEDGKVKKKVVPNKKDL